MIGQATDVAVDREGRRDEKRPFTFTLLSTDPYLEFVIKIYPVTRACSSLVAQV